MRHGAQRIVTKLEVDAFHVEQFAVLLGERVLRLQQDLDEGILIEFLERRDDRQAAHELGNQPVMDQVLGLDLVQ